MGSWTDFDAIYPPGVLTPATALLVALGHLAGADSVYAEGVGGALAAFLPTRGIAYEPDLLGRAERYLTSVPLAAFLAEAAERLNRRQRLCLLLNLIDRRLAEGDERPEAHPLIAQLREALGVAPAELAPLRQTLVLLRDLAIFPQ
ncbi:MAG: hypothetical protein HGA65_02130 [Oscillochloris sp.]|nr:hypothetical protein [Oscillochloris sp.]